jgi:predicted small secreted protein
MTNFIKMAVCLLVLAGTVAGCSNTVRGVGQDTQNAGEHIEQSAD